MKNSKPKSIQNVGLFIAIFAGFVVFSNSMGALSWVFLGVQDDFANLPVEEGVELPFVIRNYLEMCLLMIVLGGSFLVGGIFIRKHKLWANRLVSLLSGILIVIVWGLALVLMSWMENEGMAIGMRLGAIGGALFWSIPLGLILWFLNRRKIKEHFV